MKNIFRSIYQERASNPSTLGILLIEKSNLNNTNTNAFQTILLVIVDNNHENIKIKHYSYGDQKVALYIINEQTLKNWILLGQNRNIYDWIFSGKILFERNDYLQLLTTELRDFPFHNRKLRIGLEFAKLIRRYLDGKLLYEKKHFLDAYNHIIHALHHLARLSIIEKGIHPELTVWNQVKQLDPEIYKLYEELVSSEESIHKRLELLFLASEFFIHSKTELGAAHLMEVLQGKDQWSIQEILEHPELEVYSIDLFGILEHLIEKEYIEVVLLESKGKIINHRHYRVGKKFFSKNN